MKMEIEEGKFYTFEGFAYDGGFPKTEADTIEELVEKVATKLVSHDYIFGSYYLEEVDYFLIDDKRYVLYNGTPTRIEENHYYNWNTGQIKHPTCFLSKVLNSKTYKNFEINKEKKNRLEKEEKLARKKEEIVRLERELEMEG